MKPWVKILLSAVLGFGGGFAAGFYTHKKLNDVQFEEVDEIEMAAIEKKVQEKEAAAKDAPKPLTDEDLSTDPDKLRLQLQGKKSFLEADREAKEKYSEIWNTVKGYSNEENANEIPVESLEEGFDENFIQEAMDEEQEADISKVKPPYPIDLAMFYNERNEYDKITIDWYEPNTFMDEREEPIADIRSYIGEINIHDLFRETDTNDDPDIRFVRNEEYGTDYEIIRHHRTWEETTGIGGSE
jgi:hypothetical protein